MSIRVLPAVAAVLVAVALVVLLFVPYVAREHRKRGELRPGALLLFLAAVLYALGLVAYVLVPLPPIGPGFCEAFGDLRPQWRPFAGFDEVRRPGGLTELTGLVADPAVQQFGFNVLLFVPLGMFVRYLLREGFGGTALAGFMVSLAVELTQLTGIWFLYPCPYRLFDVDDLIANTSGAVLGALLAPVLRLVPGQRGAAGSGEPRPVGSYRRLLGMVCDLLLLWWLGLALARGADLLLRVAEVRPPVAAQAWSEAAALWFAPAVLLLIATAAGRGSSLGQHAVLLRVVVDGRRPGWRAVLRRWLVGLGGLALVEGVLAVLWPAAGLPVAVVWCAVHALAVPRSARCRGLSGKVAGSELVDARALTATDR
ncbi:MULTISPECIES: VanZ family protein [unclassified Saccharopolyspora]|uniref:VanZ family protein n=1 Tax=unclassified Saccharopolyspora TaxID=2646250 RepID=UPI001CD69783|nr:MULTISPECIES: VanZ family protein [unclassified Saccharopolyspora]MCA1187471.1 VanZ family protein [Saccharopolyspora sp. 6T]MCA1194700.1 VanZ family protein [Saccharopolyspora sp. 6V]MCA1225859.1 VanZ family protein [Saccharopolyspora sp. 6M]